jgi:hypothetical protein
MKSSAQRLLNARTIFQYSQVVKSLFRQASIPHLQHEAPMPSIIDAQNHTLSAIAPEKITALKTCARFSRENLRTTQLLAAQERDVRKGSGNEYPW